SVANVLVGYHLSRGERRFAWVVGVAAVCQVPLLATVPHSLRGLLWLDVLVGVVLIAVHEIVIGSSLPALGAGLKPFHAAAGPGRSVRGVLALRAAFAEGCIVVTGYVAFAIAVTWPLVLHLHTRMLGPFSTDSAGTVAWLAQLHHEGGYHFVGTTHHTLTGAP